jgi:short-subunit dehydrogenase
MALPWRIVWITGASSGMGREMALQLARAGVKVAATARSAEKLATLCAEAPGIHAFPGDVGDAEAMARVVAEIEARLGPIDLAILNAGVWQPTRIDTLAVARLTHSMHINYLGVVHGLVPLVPLMTARGRGRIAIIGSVAGYRGLPMGAAYGPSKAALINLAECLQPELKACGVDVIIVNPGVIRTPMTAPNTFPMPFIVEAEDAAARIIRGLARGRYEIAFPWPMKILMKIARILPNWLYFRIARRL